MRKYKLLLFILFLSETHLLASPADSVKTTYKNGEFITYCQMYVAASDSISNDLINRFVSQLCYDLNGLFKWGLKDMGVNGSKDNALWFDFKTTQYNSKTQILRGIGDVVVPGITTFRNLYIDNKLTLSRYNNGQRNVNLKLAGENTFIKNLDGTFIFHPRVQKRTAIYSIETHLKFGWFFDVFITQNRYKSIMEWRIKQLIQNMKEEAEKREKLHKK